MSIILGPITPPSGAAINVLFHFGPEDGHVCDCAQFDWFLNGIFVAPLNFNNVYDGETKYQGPFNILLSAYNTDPCGWLTFSFLCTTANCGGACHEGAIFDITLPSGAIKSRYISTSNPTRIWICDLLSDISSPP